MRDEQVKTGTESEREALIKMEKGLLSVLSGLDVVLQYVAWSKGAALGSKIRVKLHD